MTERAGIQALPLNMSVNGNPFLVHAAVLWDDDDAILVDTGLPGQLEVVRAALAQASVPFERLTKIIITHQDRDHIGGLREIVDASEGRIQVLAHEVGKPYLQGEIPLVKSGAYAVPVQVDETLQDGQVLPFAGGVQVVFSPGHSPDHISLYHIPSRTLISGDALTASGGVLQAFDPRHTPDQATAYRSVDNFRELDIATVIAYHGGVVTDGIRERLQAISEAGRQAGSE